ncbi:MAG: DNA-binding transcriptional ArsR family regulator [Halobacteriales archaeon]|jgi:DNA-binding transcriptional ArsR family regulator
MTEGNPLPFRPEVEDSGAAPRVLGFDEDDAHQVFDALSSETAREIYCRLRNEPRTPPELAEQVDCSLQTVHYHLRSLDEADLVEPADTGYSEKGVEMTIYRVADRPLVLTSADRDAKSRLRRFLGRILGAVGVLGGSSLVVQWWLSRTGESVGSPGASNATAPVGGPGAAVAVPPGLVFFLGGLLALAIVVALWDWRPGGPGG